MTLGKDGPILQGQGGATKTCFCLLMDVYGFSELVKSNRTAAHERLCKLHRAIRSRLSANERTYPDRHFVHFFFSDTIFVALELRVSQAQMLLAGFLALAESIYHDSLEFDLPLRGCVTYGEILIEDTSLVGFPLLDAASYEKKMRIPLLIVPVPTVRKLVECGVLSRTAIESQLPRRYDLTVLAGQETIPCHPLISTRVNYVRDYANKMCSAAESKEGLERVYAAWKDLTLLLEGVTDHA
jgi:hypothetical protein